jgi:hypothetical protein
MLMKIEPERSVELGIFARDSDVRSSPGALGMVSFSGAAWTEAIKEPQYARLHRGQWLPPDYMDPENNLAGPNMLGGAISNAQVYSLLEPGDESDRSRAALMNPDRSASDGEYPFLVLESTETSEATVTDTEDHWSRMLTIHYAEFRVTADLARAVPLGGRLALQVVAGTSVAFRAREDEESFDRYRLYVAEFVPPADPEIGIVTVNQRGVTGFFRTDKSDFAEAAVSIGDIDPNDYV